MLLWLMCPGRTAAHSCLNALTFTWHLLIYAPDSSFTPPHTRRDSSSNRGDVTVGLWTRGASGSASPPSPSWLCGATSDHSWTRRCSWGGNKREVRSFSHKIPYNLTSFLNYSPARAPQVLVLAHVCFNDNVLNVWNVKYHRPVTLEKYFTLITFVSTQICVLWHVDVVIVF